MFTVKRIGIGLCVLRMLEIFPGEREPEVQGDDSPVVVAVGKRETAIYLKRWRKMEEVGVVPM